MKGNARDPVAVVGGGALGLSAALALRRRGHAVALYDTGPLPRPEASSTDSSRAVRADYGNDLIYTELAELALARWHDANAAGERVFFPDGFALLTRAPMRPGEYEHDSFELLRRRGYPLERLRGDALALRLPALAGAGFVDGYFNPRGGWVDAARATALLAGQAREAGVDARLGVACTGLVFDGARAVGLHTDDGGTHPASVVVVAAGAWTPELLPWLADRMRAVAQPVLYFRAAEAHLYRSPRLAPFAADIARTGWYGFPATADGIVKIANHGPGLPLSPRGPRHVPADAEPRARAFLRATLPALADAPLADAKLCFYCDTFDGDFWIDRDPEHPGLVVAAGGSGHAFKFAPVLGAYVADAVEGTPQPRAARFRWREAGTPRREGARSGGAGASDLPSGRGA